MCDRPRCHPLLVGLVVLSVAAGTGACGGAREGSEPAGSTETPQTMTPQTVTPQTVTPQTVPPQNGTDPVSEPVIDQGVTGRVTGPDGGVSGAMVQPAPGPGNPAPEREVFARSLADGSYLLGLTPGAWDLTISAEGYLPVVLRVTVPAGRTVEVDVELRPAD